MVALIYIAIGQQERTKVQKEIMVYMEVKYILEVAFQIDGENMLGARKLFSEEHYFTLFTQIYSDRWQMYGLGSGRKQLILEEAKTLKPNNNICEEADTLLAPVCTGKINFIVSLSNSTFMYSFCGNNYTNV